MVCVSARCASTHGQSPIAEVLLYQWLVKKRSQTGLRLAIVTDVEVPVKFLQLCASLFIRRLDSIPGLSYGVYATEGLNIADLLIAVKSYIRSGLFESSVK